MSAANQDEEELKNEFRPLVSARDAVWNATLREKRKASKRKLETEDAQLEPKKKKTKTRTFIEKEEHLLSVTEKVVTAFMADKTAEEIQQGFSKEKAAEEAAATKKSKKEATSTLIDSLKQIGTTQSSQSASTPQATPPHEPTLKDLPSRLKDYQTSFSEELSFKEAGDIPTTYTNSGKWKKAFPHPQQTFPTCTFCGHVFGPNVQKKDLDQHFLKSGSHDLAVAKKKKLEETDTTAADRRDRDTPNSVNPALSRRLALALLVSGVTYSQIDVLLAALAGVMIPVRSTTESRKVMPSVIHGLTDEYKQLIKKKLTGIK